MAVIFIVVLLIITAAEGRILRLNSFDDQLISDGIDGPETALTAGCNHQYGFLPCAENAGGYIFMIVVYQMLLVVGDMLMSSGGEVLFYIIGKDFGGILFRILKALPSMMLIILTGIFSDKEHAQSQVSAVIGVNAGMTVFSLTVQWIRCMASASKSLKNEKDEEEERETSKSNCFTKLIRILIDNGIEVDEETCTTAGIMVLSLAPYLVLELVYLFTTLSGKRVLTFIALAVSSLSLIYYFVYQIRNPWMQKRSWTSIAVEELENLAGGQTELVDDILKKFDTNNDNIITEAEFVDGFMQWIHDEAKDSASNAQLNPNQVFRKAKQLLQEKKPKNFSKIDKIMSKIILQAMRSGSLFTDDGKPNLERIRSLFREADTNGNGRLTEEGFKNLTSKLELEKYQMKDDDVIKEMFKQLHHNDGDMISEQEFVTAVTGYLDKAMDAVNTLDKSKVVEEYDKMVWEEALYDNKAFVKSVFQVLLGIAMLTFLGGPLMTNILELSNSMNFPSFIISFVAVPLALNARVVIAAILPAVRKTEKTASLQFSEIYGGVIMNNISGLTTLLAIVCAKELIWDFSAEVLTILVVCGVIGIQAFWTTTYRLWICIPAFLLYPTSLGLLYFLQVICGWN